MTEGELAEEYSKGLCKTCTVDTCRYNTLQTCAIKESIKQAFFAGLKAKIQWHDLRKNPDDLPKENSLVLSDKGMIVMWRDFSWAEYSPNYDNIKLRKWEEPIAWCELPTFKE